MRFSRIKRRTSIKKGQIDIAPLIDVMFLLLIFFMLTSNFVLQPGIKVRIPKAVTSEIIETENIVISVTGQDLLYLNYKPIRIKELSALLQKAAIEDVSVLIKADVGSSLGRIVEIWDLCRELGIEKVNLATNQVRKSY